MPAFKPIWITAFTNAEEIREKLGSKYGIDVDEIKRYALTNSQLRGRDVIDEVHGLRTVIIIVLPRGKTIMAWIELENSEIHTWKIRTARYIN